MSTRKLAWSALLLAGCVSDQPLQKSQAGSSFALPSLQLVHRGLAVNDSIDDRIMKIAVDHDGRVAVIPSMSGSPRIRFVDSTGHFDGAAGRAGSGPGELGFPGRVWWVGDTLVAYETGRLVQIRYDKKGALLRESTIRDGVVPLAAGAEGMLEFDYTWRERGRPAVLSLRRTDESRPRPVLDERHPQLARALDMTKGMAITYPWPVAALRNGVLALIEPRSPTVWYFTLAGQMIDSVSLEGASRARGPAEFAEELDGLARSEGGGTIGPNGERYPGPDFDSVRKVIAVDRPPVAFIHGANFDGSGRLWIVGPHRDSTRAIVLAGATTLGTLMLPCFRVGRFVSISDRWLALLCSNGQGADPPFELQLYRVVEPAGKRP